MKAETLVKELRNTQEYFDRSTRCLTENDSNFVAAPGAMTAAQQVAHVALTIDWFFEGAFRPEGFDMDFEEHHKAVAAVTSLKAAREQLARSFDEAAKALGGKSEEELHAPLPEGPVMGGAPRFAIVGAIADHTAHHRGALTIYSRLCEHTPAMPYMEA